MLRYYNKIYPLPQLPPTNRLIVIDIAKIRSTSILKRSKRNFRLNGSETDREVQGDVSGKVVLVIEGLDGTADVEVAGTSLVGFRPLKPDAVKGSVVEVEDWV